jgi:hypothetical protein
MTSQDPEVIHLMDPAGAVFALFHDRPESRTWQFFCPGCQGPHYVQDRATSGPVWEFSGDQVRPTVSPSIRTSQGEGTECHSFVRDGQIQFLEDCWHSLRGRTVPIPVFD